MQKLHEVKFKYSFSDSEHEHVLNDNHITNVVKTAMSLDEWKDQFSKEMADKMTSLTKEMADKMTSLTNEFLNIKNASCKFF